MKLRLVSLFLVMLLAGGLGWRTTLAQSEQEEYFKETGHRVAGEFLIAFHRVPNPLQIYGYPITDAFQDPTSGIWIQYFQKARFELRMDAPPGQRVRVTPLGQYLYVPGQPLPFPKNSPACRLIQPTNFYLCYDFLTFFEKNGGVAVFGYPVSNLEWQNGHPVQYFQYARLEWHPGQGIVLSNLGSLYFNRQGEDPARLQPSRDQAIINGVLSLRVRAFPELAVIASSGSQTITIIVQDQRLLPVANAQVTLVVRLPSGEESRYIVPSLTDARGLTQYTFPFNAKSIGLVEIRVTVTYNQLQGQTKTSFRIWW